MNQILINNNSPYLLEKFVRDYLASNLNSLGVGALKLVGVEHQVPSGRIDILALENDGTKLAIELKRGTATREAVGQLQAYVGDLLQEKNCQKARGILIASAFDQGAISASKATSLIQLVSFHVEFVFAPVKNKLNDIFPQREQLPSRSDDIEKVINRRYCNTCKINVTAQRRSDGFYYCNTCNNID